MKPFKKTLKHAAALIPAIRRLLAERDALREETSRLQRETLTLQSKLKAARTQLLESWKRHPELRVPPGHFYSPIPAIVDLKINEDEVFGYPPAIRGVDLNEAAQVDLLKRFAAFYREQPFTAERVQGRRYFFENPNYSYNDAIVLYCLIRHVRPKRIVEVGSGYSSCAMLDVNELFFGDAITCTFIDPYPQLLRDLIKASDHDRVRIIGEKVQAADIDIFRELAASDILFIDSSHVAKTGSDVNYILFKILPLLREGVYIHFHDIFYPFEYPTEWVYEGRAWNEAYLLRAFMQYNRAFEIQFFNSFLISKYRDVFEADMPLCLKGIGANLWLRKTTHEPELDRANARTQRKTKPAPASLDVTRPELASFLGDGWYEPEPEHCWMTRTASFRIAGPTSTGQRLSIRAVSPVDGSRLTATGDGIALGSLLLPSKGDVAPEFLLPDDLIGRSTITIHLSVDRIHTAPGDPRKLGLAVSRLEIV
jgi:predicted O-methyltransferase YrrM